MSCTRMWTQPTRARPQTAHTQGSAEPHHTMHPIKTYIVEDSQVIRDNLIATLEDLVPIEVVGTAEDESTAVHWLTQSQSAVDLVIVDIFLKKGSGLGVLRAIERRDDLRKVVVLSNYATPDVRRRCLELKADRVFDKSTEIDGLIAYCEALANDDTTFLAAKSP